MLQQAKRIAFRISSVLSKVEPEPDLHTGSDPKATATAPQYWSRPSFLVPPPELFFVSRTEQSWFWRSPSTGISLPPDFSLCLEQDTESMMVKAPYFEALKAEMADLYGDQAEMVSQYIF